MWREVVVLTSEEAMVAVRNLSQAFFGCTRSLVLKRRFFGVKFVFVCKV